MKLRRIAGAVLIASLAAAPSVRGEDDSSLHAARPDAGDDRIVLTAHGKAHGVADSVEIEFVVEASAEDAHEAESKHRTKLKAVWKALEELRASVDPAHPAAAPTAATDEDAPRPRRKKHPTDEDDDASPTPAPKKTDADDDLRVPIVVREGRSIFGLARDNGQPDKAPEVTVATAVQVVMEGLSNVPRAALRKRLARIVDKAIEAGADSGGADSGGAVGHGIRPAFRFKVKDNEALREEAYKVAVQTGRDRATRLARLAGREIQVLTTVRETAWQLRAGSDDSGTGFDVVVGRVGNNKPNNHDLLVSTTECELEVQLEMEFLLKPVTTAK